MIRRSLIYEALAKSPAFIMSSHELAEQLGVKVQAIACMLKGDKRVTLLCRRTQPCKCHSDWVNHIINWYFLDRPPKWLIKKYPEAFTQEKRRQAGEIAQTLSSRSNKKSIAGVYPLA